MGFTPKLWCQRVIILFDSVAFLEQICFMFKFNPLGSIGSLVIGYFYFRIMMYLFGALPGGVAALIILVVSQILIARFGSVVVWPVINTLLAGYIILITL